MNEMKGSKRYWQDNGIQAFEGMGAFLQQVANLTGCN